jgi:predicted nucleic acid-binding protein
LTTVVVNASPLIFLGKAGRLELLRALGDRVLVPEPVFSEIAAGSDDGADRVAGRSSAV